MELENFLYEIGFGSAFGKLLENGIETVKALESCSLDDLESVLPPLAAKAIIRKISSQGQQNVNNQQQGPNNQPEQESSKGKEIVIAKDMEIFQLKTQLEMKLTLAEIDKKQELMKKDYEHQLDLKGKEIEMLNMRIEHAQKEGDLKANIVEAEMKGKIAVAEAKLEESKKPPPSMSEIYPPWWNTSFPFYPPNAVLLTPHFYATISSWLGASPRQWTLRYRASRDGMSASAFHNLCNGFGPTITIIKSNGYLFGGYNTQSWAPNSAYHTGAGSFIFTLTNPHGTGPTAFHNKRERFGGYSNATYGPSFGGGHDFYIHPNNNCCFNFPHSYNDTLGYGSSTFTGLAPSPVTDYEVFSV